MLLAGYQIVKKMRLHTNNAFVEVFGRYFRLHTNLKRILFLYLIEHSYKS